MLTLPTSNGMKIIKDRKILFFVAIGIITVSLDIISVFGLRLGIDFTGGALTEVSYSELPEKSLIEDVLDSMELGSYSLRKTADEAGRNGYILRTRDLTEEERQEVELILLDAGTGGELIRFTSIGPVIGEELKSKAVWAIIAVALVIILYVAFAFRGVNKPVGSWVYGGITILALLHDILVPTAVMSLLGYFAGIEINVLFIMAILAVLVYSVNDTIVVFDRVRENLIKYRQEKKGKKNVAGVMKEEIAYLYDKPFAEIVGMSVSQTLTRSINTSLTTIFVLLALYYIGGDVTRTFSLILIAGVIAGTYSSICIANPLLVILADRNSKQ